MLRVSGIAVGLTLAGAMAAIAQGTCPAGVARDGVWLAFADRAVLTRVLSDGRVAEMEFARDGTYVYEYRTLPIGLVTESWALENGFASRSDRETVTYVGTPASVPAPVPGARFDGIETARYPDGSETRSTLSLVVGDARPVTIGGCSYTGLPVDVTRVPMNNALPQRDSMMHLVDLGLTIYLGFAEGNDPPQDALPISISTEPPPVDAAAAPGAAPPPLPGVPAPAPTK